MAEVDARAREGSLFPDQTPEDVRAEVERLIRTGRKPYPILPGGPEKTVHEMPSNQLVEQTRNLTSWTTSGDEATVQDAVTGLLRRLTADGR